jgi:hypothetical protein
MTPFIWLFSWKADEEGLKHIPNGGNTGGLRETNEVAPEDLLKFDNLDYLVTDRVAEITMRRARMNTIDHQRLDAHHDFERRRTIENTVETICNII